MDAQTEQPVEGHASAGVGDRPSAADRTGLANRPDSGSGRDYWADRSAQLEQAAHLTSVREQLRIRRDGLPPGHPSSPLNADGSLRPPVPRLADLDQSDQPRHARDGDRPTSQPPATDKLRDNPEPPLGDAEYADHVRRVATALEKARADGLATHKQYALDADHETWQPQRRIEHDKIVKEMYEAATDVPCDRKAIIAGGLGGAGKTTILEQHAGIDRTQYLTINPDDFKDELARRGLVPKIPGLSPMEATNLVHEESSHLARRLATLARAEGKNIIWDITMSSPDTAAGRIEDLRTFGYQQVDGLFVDIPVGASIARNHQRHRHGHDRYLSGLGLGGRLVPGDVIRSQADPDYGTINRRAFEALKDRFDHWRIYDNSVDGRPRVLVDRGGRSNSDASDREFS